MTSEAEGFPKTIFEDHCEIFDSSIHLTSRGQQLRLAQALWSTILVQERSHGITTPETKMVWRGIRTDATIRCTQSSEAFHA